MTKKQNPLRGLYAVSPDNLLEETLLASAEAALKGGARLFQYRDKRRSLEERVPLALKLHALCARYGALFIVNDSVEIAININADGVHLGKDDGDITRARKLLGEGKILGVSCYADLGRANLAVAAGADYVAFGAVAVSPTKPHAPHAPLSLVRDAKQSLDTTICTIGGITLAMAPSLIAAGADLLAVITDLFEADDIEAQARAYHEIFAGELL